MKGPNFTTENKRIPIVYSILVCSVSPRTINLQFRYDIGAFTVFSKITKLKALQ